MKTLEDYVRLLEEGRIISLSQGVDDKLNDKFRTDFTTVAKELKSKEDKTIGIIINTNGGDPARAIQLQTEIQAIARVYDVWLLCGSPDNSAGVILTLSLPVKQRLGFPNFALYAHYSRTTIPETKNSIQKHIEYEVLENNERSNSMKYHNDYMVSLIARETVLSNQEARQLMDKPKVIRAREAVKLGFISKVLK
jgi:ATP-dependent protease ClpP protease subunit